MNISTDFIQMPSLLQVLGELQDTCSKRISIWNKGYTKGQPDLMIMNYHKDYSGYCIEFKSSTNNYQVSQAQKEMKHRYKENGLFSPG